MFKFMKLKPVTDYNWCVCVRVCVHARACVCVKKELSFGYATHIQPTDVNILC